MTTSEQADLEPLSDTAGPAHAGLDALRNALPTLPATPGVYRMLNGDGDVLYVGKARNLKRRVTSYTQLARLPIRLQRMVAQIAALEVVTTHTEAEALLLESNLIKRLAPRYNVLLRDDKSFPYILLTSQLNRKILKTGADPQKPRRKRQDSAKPSLKGDGPSPADWVGVTKYRGARTADGEYFGPFASAGAVNRTLNALERAFLLRSCSDAIFSGRARACLKYQLKRCSGPCVGYITAEDYEQLVRQARNFLGGQSREVQESIAADMQTASDNLEFEAAARARDRIRALTQIQAHQDINVENLKLPEADVIAAWQTAGQTCIQVFFFRGGRNYGNRAYYPRHDKSVDIIEVLTAFVGQFYEDKPPPRVVLLSHQLPEHELLSAALTVRADHKVAVTHPVRGARRKLVQHALDNARDALQRRLAEKASNQELMEKAAELFGLDGAPARIEVYDNSHVGGQHAIGAMIVAGPDGFIKGAYRKFNMKGDAGNKEDGYAPGDDYAMMREMLSRRFARAIKEDPERTGGQWPDLILIDGGQGQLSASISALEELGIDDVAVVAIAKGPDRDAGRERFFTAEREPFSLPPQDALLYYLQRLRDEAHRFAIGTHRAKRSKAIANSPLDEISGVGAKRKRALLTHFGSARAVARAGLKDLEEVEGISGAVAKTVYNHFHSDG
ncbi:MAG: excinuclease ABC subunit UvrC [Alphaproteobacteria bacterium]|nr:excinuclease ABC subunit UvrC [Alphaproteobacteria bacterium]